MSSINDSADQRLLIRAINKGQAYAPPNILMYILGIEKNFYQETFTDRL